MNWLLHQLIEQHAARQPMQAAIACRDEELSYGQLYRRSASLARALRAAGVKAGDRVGIYMHKCVDCATAIYGIMAAGAAYVPLDPTAPAARLHYVIDHCGIEVLVSELRMASALPDLCRQADIRCVIGAGEQIAHVETSVDWRQISASLTDSYPALNLTENTLAYILFTSGSTGVPKGIMHTHGSAMAWADVTAEVYELTPRDRVSNYAPLHFDLSTLDYFGTARAGATTVIIPEEYTRFPASLAALIAQQSLTIFYTVPYALVQLLRAGALEQHDYSSLRAVLFGGEPMPPKYLLELMGHWPGTQFYNVYGPTETNGVTHHRVAAADLDVEAAIPIGTTYPNVEALIVDDQDQLVTDPAPGELLISAGTSMRGYWKRPELNTGVFCYRQQDGQRPDVFVRTGDLVRRRADGVLDFLGRKDRLVKTRGYRVELDDVEATVVAHPEVAEGAAFAVPDPTGSVVIEAAVIPLDEVSFSLVALQEHLRRHLPPYALPRSIQVMDSFPRTSSGKTDRVTLASRAAGK